MFAYNDYDYPKRISQKINTRPSLSIVSPFTDFEATGGRWTREAIIALRKQAHEPQITIEPSISTHKIDTRSPSELVAFIQKTFSISTSDLADLLNVTRPTIYAWLDGQEPKPEAINRIQKISKLADKFLSLNITHINALVCRPIFNGRSLLDKIKSEEDISESFNILKDIATKEEKAKKISKGSNKYKRSFSEAALDYSTPLHRKV
jgi:transcriptional regulator with XRE-family HTH domain